MLSCKRLHKLKGGKRDTQPPLPICRVFLWKYTSAGGFWSQPALLYRKGSWWCKISGGW